MGMLRPLSYEGILGRSKLEGRDTTFQQDMVDKLYKITDYILGVDLEEVKSKNKILLKSPTGSGKTVMVGGYIDMLFANYRDMVVLWVSETPNLTSQSLEKVNKLFNISTVFYGEDVNQEISNHTVVGINWEKIKNTKARTDTEVTKSIDTLVSVAREEGKKVVIVVDEAHSHANSKLSKEFLSIVAADIELSITATPLSDAMYDYKYEVDVEDVQRAGFIKQGIIINDLEEDYTSTYRDTSGVQDVTEYFLHQSLQKRNKLEVDVARYAKSMGKEKFIPLLVVQLPNNANEVMEKVEGFFSRQGYSRDRGNLAVYTSGDYTDELDVIGKDEEVKILLFKQAISKGWDCPRASVITLLRDPKRHHFVVQTVGRILRMPYLEEYSAEYDYMNYGYVYIEETDNLVLQRVKEDIQSEDISIPLYKRTGLDTEIDEIKKQVWELEGEKVTRNIKLKKLVTILTDKMEYDSWLNYLGGDVGGKYVTRLLKGQIGTKDVVEGREVDLTKEGLEDVVLEYTLKDLYMEFKKVCIVKGLKPVDIENTIDLIEIVILPSLENITEYELYLRILNNKDKFLDDMGRLNEEVESAVEERYVKVFKEWQIPVQWVIPADAKKRNILDETKVPYGEVWLGDNKLEEGFVDYLDKLDTVKLWYKNGDKGSKYFSIAYEQDGKNRHFYPDFLVETDDVVYILETKGRLDSEENIEKVKSMRDYRIKYMAERDREVQAKNVILGYVKEYSGNFYMYKGNNFKEDMNNLTGWEVLDIQ